MISVDEKSTENVKINKIIKKSFLKKEENFDTIIFNVVDMKNSNAKIFIKYYINDMMMISNNFTKKIFEFENFLKEKNATQTREKEQKKKNLKKNDNKSFEKTKKKKINE